jgi:hypothetical protein
LIHPANRLGQGFQTPGTSDANPAPHPTHARVAPVGTKQNTGNFLTSRKMVRVAAPPGGASSIIFG